jgi:hypothetical protein
MGFLLNRIADFFEPGLIIRTNTTSRSISGSSHTITYLCPLTSVPSFHQHRTNHHETIAFIMAKTIFTTITPLPAGISREVVLDTLHSHAEMIDLNPTHTERHRINPPPEATPEEYHCAWYQITDKISYLPGISGSVSFKTCFHDLANGMQNRVYAPMGLDIKEKWTLGGNLPGEPIQPAEIGIGAPITGLYLREDIEIKCNFIVTRFVKKQLKDALATLVARLVVKSQLQEAAQNNRRLQEYAYSPHSPQPMTPPLSPPLSGGLDMQFPRHSFKPQRFSTQTAVSEMDGSQKSPRFPSRQSSGQRGEYANGPVELPT